MDIQVIHDKDEYRAMFYYKGHVHTCYGSTAREARQAAQEKIKVLKGETLL